MTGNKSEDCKKQRKAIAKSNQPAKDEGWQPKPATGATFYRLIPEDKYNPKSSRIDRGAFEDAGFSVLAAGGNFPEMDVKQTIQQKNREIVETQQRRQKYVGAVKIEPSVFTSGVYGKFDIEHDPNPVKVGGEPQESNHFSVVCVKPEALVDKFVEEPDWAVAPTELNE